MTLVRRRPVLEHPYFGRVTFMRGDYWEGELAVPGEQSAEQPFPHEWRDEFSLPGLGVPPRRDEAEPWDIGYFVDAANHYFTAHFEGGRPSYLTVDG